MSDPQLPTRPLRPAARAAMFAAFFLSGACGLAYEVVWTRLIAREVGHTSFALATVLAAFMGGLALGSAVAGRIISRLKNPLAGYGLLEVAIAGSALSVPSLLLLIHPVVGFLYRSDAFHGAPCHAARFALCAFVLLVPTTCMGATLPLLSERLVRRREEAGGTLGWLYAANTLGAVAGALAAGFLLLPAHGMSFTLHAAAAANLLVGVGALLLSRGVPAAEPGPEEHAPHKGRPRGRSLFLWGMLLSGAFAMANQVVWTRYLSLQIGTSVYAFTIIVSAFILGMAGGSLWFGRRADRSRDLLASFGRLQIAIGFSSLLLCFLFAALAVGVWDLIQENRGSFARLQLAFFGTVFGIVLLPTFFLGGTFPTAVKGYLPFASRTGRAVGRVYAWNTIGAILGSLAGGFVIVPRLGVWHAIVGLAIGNVALGAIMLLRSTSRLRALGAAASVAVAGAVVLSMPAWDAGYLAHGAYVYAAYDTARGRTGRAPSPLRPEVPFARKICWHRDGASASVSVVATENDMGVAESR